jgi:plastocyanin
MSRLAFISTLGILALAACSSGGTPDGTTGGATIMITNYHFIPDPLIVGAGATVTITNTDKDQHTATSEASAESYVMGAVPNGFTFSTTLDGGDTVILTIPTGVPSGTKQPYFCQNHKGMMFNPDPIIQIK